MAYPPPPKALFVPVIQDDDVVFNRESGYPQGVRADR